MTNRFFLLIFLLFSVSSMSSELEKVASVSNLKELNHFISEYSKTFKIRNGRFGIVNNIYVKDNAINYDYILDNNVFVSVKAVKEVIFDIGTDFRDGYCEDFQFTSIQKLNVPIRVNYFHKDEPKDIYKLSIEKEDCSDI
jgi:hypothetical protein